MAGVVRISAAGRNAMLDALREMLAGGTLELYTAPQPAAPETPISTQTKLGTLTLADPIGLVASGGVLTFDAITQDAAADAGGVIAWGRIKTADGDALTDLEAGAAGAGTALELDTTTVAAGQPLQVASATLAIPTSG